MVGFARVERFVECSTKLFAAAWQPVWSKAKDSRWTAVTEGIAFFAYSTNYLIDTAHGVILDVEATPARRTEEVESTKVMVDRVVRQIATTPEYQRSSCERKKVEMLFAHLKSILKLNRLRLRGLSGVTDKFTLAATVQSLRRMAKLLAHSPPIDRIGAPA